MQKVLMSAPAQTLNLSKNKELIIQKSDEENSVVCDRHIYIRKMKNIVIDQNKFPEVNLKDDNLLNIIVNHEKVVYSNSMAEKNRKSLNLVGNKPGAMCALCKVHKVSVNNL